MASIIQSVLQNQAQVQAQAQSQVQFTSILPFQMAQLQFLNGLLTSSVLPVSMSIRQVARAKNQSVVVGNLGAVTTGAQNANPLNVA